MFQFSKKHFFLTWKTFKMFQLQDKLKSVQCLQIKWSFYYLFKILFIFNGNRWFPIFIEVAIPIFIEVAIPTFKESDFIPYLEPAGRSKKDMEVWQKIIKYSCFKIKIYNSQINFKVISVRLASIFVFR